MKHLLCWTHEILLQLGNPSPMIPFPKFFFIKKSSKLGFCIIRDNVIFSQRGWFLKNIDCVILDWMITFYLAKHDIRSLQNSIRLLSFIFIPLEQILNVFLNGFRKRVVTHHKTLSRTRIRESSIELDLWHHNTTRGTPLLWFHFSKMVLFDNVQN
jgi:hypothetical protein